MHVLDDIPAELYRAAFDRSGVPTVLVGASGRIVRANPALGTVLGRDPAQLAGRDARELLPPGDRDEDWTTHAGPSFAVECRCLRGDGRTVWVQLDATLVTGGNLFVQLRELPTRDRDPVTGLPSRARFDAAVAAHAAQMQRYGADGAVVVLDLDGFRTINAQLGEVAGDGILSAVADALRGRLRTTDLVSRTSDEFRVLLPRGTASEALVVAGHLRDAVRTAVDMGCSIGVAPFSDPDDPVAVVQRAHAALRDVRRAGGNGVAAALVAA
ncbi:MAG TPA: sensor domain-containing diguanylate cyclase [Solirubrobacteraceae bacterium]